MNYLYHRVPKNVRGNILYPLNAIKEIHPEIYEQEVSKYNGREHIARQQIPVLNCLWNDVLHFSAVNPKEVKHALIEAGKNPDFIMNCYQVDPKLIAPENAIVYLYAHTDDKDKLNENNFASFDPDEVAKFSPMPQATKDFYKEMIRTGGRTFLFHRIPHILYRGTIDITDLPIVSV